MVHKFIYWLTGYLKCRIINSGGKPYLERYYLGTLFNIRYFIHRFVASDPDRGLHNHPWPWALSWILLGGYLELNLAFAKDPKNVTAIKTKKRKIGRFNFIKGGRFHRVLVPKGQTGDIWTLFIHGNRKKDATWGFLTYNENLDGTIKNQKYHPVNMKEERKRNDHWWQRANCKTGNQVRKENDRC